MSEALFDAVLSGGLVCGAWVYTRLKLWIRQKFDTWMNAPYR